MNRLLAGLSLLLCLTTALVGGVGPEVHDRAHAPADTSTTDSPELQRRLAAALAAKGPDYRPRTEHLFPDGRPRYTNRLILEDSPYLIQHAHNPVDWYAWFQHRRLARDAVKASAETAPTDPRPPQRRTRSRPPHG
ncbi:DUF255 domain-containing protein [Thiocapsa sp. UBA6158]|jgi:hypothetical protein|uniref:DUF255 domain-containing protein n=1 Tax=Thiocapsa sp. UBA6158 TaxID=1947692 RepID=UPI0025F00E36|nr:DUF255 domain-containing protein [Thiocapsa sp. UBA6158]